MRNLFQSVVTRFVAFLVLGGTAEAVEFAEGLARARGPSRL